LKGHQGDAELRIFMPRRADRLEQVSEKKGGNFIASDFPCDFRDGRKPEKFTKLDQPVGE